MRLGRLFFAGAVLLGLAWFALRSPLPAVDPRFYKQDFSNARAPLSITLYLETGYSRERAKAEAEAANVEVLKALGPVDPDEATLLVSRAELLDAIAARLKDAGIANVMIRYGGNLVVRGRRGDAPWRVGLRDPRRGPADAMAYLLADRDDAVVTLGELPVVTLVGADARRAAAAAPGLLAAGKNWPELARQQGFDQVIAVDASGAVTVTPDLAKRLKFLNGITPNVSP